MSTRNWQALAREAALAAEHLAIGASVIEKADLNHEGIYSQMLFALSLGMERAAKLALVVDYALRHEGAYPQASILRTYGHDLTRLLEAVDEIAERRGLGPQGKLPRSAIHDAIIEVLQDFATNITRYYNLDVLTGDSRVANRVNPTRAWFEKVTVPVLRRHHPEEVKAVANCEPMRAGEIGSTDEWQAQSAAAIRNLFMRSTAIHRAKPYTRMYVLQIARFLGGVVGELGYAGYSVKSAAVPHLSEFFMIFNNEDQYFRKRKTWSIYRP